MRLAGVSIVKNEQDIIESFVRHNLQYLDSLHIIDHDSFDETGGILNSLKDEGLPIYITKEKKLEYNQSKFITQQSRKVFASQKSDFIFLLDADEFVRVDTRDNLEQALSLLNQNEFGLIPWVTYVMHDDNCANEQNILNKMGYRRSEEGKPYYKVVLPKIYNNSLLYRVTMGNHSVKNAIGKVNHTILNGVQLAHFPVRNNEQLASKIVRSRISTMMNENILTPNGQNWHIKNIYEQIKSHGYLNNEDALRMSLYYAYSGDAAIQYVYDPILVSYKLHYTPADTLNSLQVSLYLFEKYISKKQNAINKSFKYAINRLIKICIFIFKWVISKLYFLKEKIFM